jgi:REP element-mobilizing transposase RayT
MANTYSLNLVHCIFSTKDRMPLMAEPERFWAMLRGVVRDSRIHVHAIGGTADHIHALLEVPKTRSIADVVRELKANSSARIRKSKPIFGWQTGYGSISVSPSAVSAVKRYIQNQGRHHRHVSFEEEYVAILERAGVKYDPKYVFD